MAHLGLAMVREVLAIGGLQDLQGWWDYEGKGLFGVGLGWFTVLGC